VDLSGLKLTILPCLQCFGRVVYKAAPLLLLLSTVHSDGLSSLDKYKSQCGAVALIPLVITEQTGVLDTRTHATDACTDAAHTQQTVQRRRSRPWSAS
jgi:hypothetical protein